jgi:hypothetical protein
MSSNGPQCGASRWKAISTKVARPGSLFSMRLRFQYVFGFFKTGGSFGEIIVASRAGAKVFLARPWTAPSRSMSADGRPAHRLDERGSRRPAIAGQLLATAVSLRDW